MEVQSLKPPPRAAHVRWLTVAGVLGLAACDTIPLQQTGTLQSYAGLERSDGLVTKALVHAESAELRAAHTVRVLPTTFSTALLSDQAALTGRQKALVASAVNRSLCIGLSERFTMVDQSQPADLTVRAVITGLGKTDEIAAGVSKGVSIVPTLLQVPVPTPRIPVGLGSLSAEVEAQDADGGQAAAMVWARKAQVMGSSTTVSKIGDAYDLADELGQDFSRLLVDGKSPFGRLPALPSSERLGAALGLDPEQSVCRTFGSGPGLRGTIGSVVGLPPEWTDDGPPPAR
jgi:hypothetical protein